MLNLLYLFILFICNSSHGLIGLDDLKPIDTQVINLEKISTIPSLEYLGCGYLLPLNPKAESEQEPGIDLNYKNPVIKFKWSPNMDSLNNTLEFIHPVGTYIYNFPQCSVTQENNLKETFDNLENIVNAEVSVDLMDLNGGAKGKKLRTNNDLKKSLERTVYCSIYVSGFTTSKNIEYTDGFISAISNLRSVIRAESKLGCNIKKYRRKICSRVMEEWTNFLNSYGTHYITKIVLGGKIVYNHESSDKINSESNSEDLNLNLTGIDVTNLNNLSKSTNDTKTSENINFFGGMTYDDNSLWFNELKKDPVPIKLILVSYKDIMDKCGIYNEYIKFIKILSGNSKPINVRV